MSNRQLYLALSAVLLVGGPAHAEDGAKVAPPKPAGTSTANNEKAPSSLVILFREGSSKLRPVDMSTLDHASRAYNAGKPIIMTITGSADRSGNPVANLRLSQQRANAVLRGLLDRGIPAEKFQVLAKGETELAVPTAQGVPERENRRVVISWH